MRNGRFSFRVEPFTFGVFFRFHLYNITRNWHFTKHLRYLQISVNIMFMLKIRLQRIGRKNEAQFRAVLTDSKNSTKSGRFLEILGTYNPKSGVIAFKEDRVKHWMKNGAQATDTVHNFFVHHKIIEGKKKNVLSKKSPTKARKTLKQAA